MDQVRPYLLRAIGLLMLALSLTTLILQTNVLLQTPLGFELLNNLSFLLLFGIGGIQLLRLQFSGHRITLIWLGLVAARSFMAFIPALILEIRTSGAPGTGFLIASAGNLLLPGLLLLIALFLLRPANRDLVHRDVQTTRWIAQVFAWLTPGLGRALVSSYWLGMLLYMAYFLIMSLRGSLSLPFSIGDSVFRILLGVLIWAGFTTLDYYAVRRRRG